VRTRADCFSGIENAGNHGIARRDMVALQPEQDVGLAAHRADFDDLLQAEEMGWDAAVDDVGKAGIFAVEGFNYGRGVDSSGGAESVVAHDGIIWRDGSVRGFRDFLAIFLQAGEVAVDQAHQAEIYEHEFHRRVAHSFAEGICGGMDLIRAGGDGG